MIIDNPARSTVPDELWSKLEFDIDMEKYCPSFDLLCPKCGRLAQEFIFHYCSKGFKAGLISVYEGQDYSERGGRLWGLLALVLIASSAFFLFVASWKLFIFCLAGGGLAAYIFVWDFFTASNRIAKRVSEETNSLSEKDAEIMLCDLIKGAGGRLPHATSIRRACRKKHLSHSSKGRQT
jgi:hypothetical protein